MSKKPKATPTQVLTITWSGRTTRAHLRKHTADGDASGAFALARCNPNDAFDPYEGARIALARVFEKDPFPKEAEAPGVKEPECPFKIGDFVKTQSGVFHPKYNFCGARVHKIERKSDNSWQLQLAVLDPDGLAVRAQTCVVHADKKEHPIELLYRPVKEETAC